MKVFYSYLDFLVKTFDVKSKTSRKCYWVVFCINAAFSVLLTSIGVIIPQGRPLEVYIGISSVIATPLFIPFFTIIARRLNDIDVSRKAMWILLIPGFGLIPLLVLCAFPSNYETQEDLSVYRQGTVYAAVKKVVSSAVTIFPYVYLVYSIFRLVTASGTFEVGLSASMLSINFLICLFTILEGKSPKFGKFLPVWKVIKSLTAISSAVLSIIFYHDAQSLIDAVITVYLYFYVMIIPFVLVANIVNLFRMKQTEACP